MSRLETSDEHKSSLSASVSRLSEEALVMLNEHKRVAGALTTVAALGTTAFLARTHLEPMIEDAGSALLKQTEVGNAVEQLANKAGLVRHLATSVDADLELPGVFTQMDSSPGMFGMSKTAYYEEFHLGYVKYPIGRALKSVGIKPWTESIPGYGSNDWDIEQTAFERFSGFMGKTLATPIAKIDSSMTTFLTERFAQRQEAAMAARRLQFAQMRELATEKV